MTGVVDPYDSSLLLADAMDLFARVSRPSALECRAQQRRRKSAPTKASGDEPQSSCCCIARVCRPGLAAPWPFAVGRHQPPRFQQYFNDLV